MAHIRFTALTTLLALCFAGCQPVETPAEPVTETKAPEWAMKPPRADAAAVDRLTKSPSDYGPAFLPDKDGSLHTDCPRESFSLSSMWWGEPEKISLITFPQEHVEWGERRGFAVRITNRTGKVFSCGGCDGSLNIVQEALDGAGMWREIESIPTSWCGVSYMIRNKLESDRFWQFAAPEFSGTMKTRLRFRWDLTPTVYSNEFEGSINPSQFVDPRAEKSGR